MVCIYKITSPVGGVYIGQTRDLRKRINCHRHTAKTSKKTNVLLINSMRKYGFDEHIFEVIEEVPVEKLDEREIYWIQHYKSYYADNPNGLNMNLGGEGQKWDSYKDPERKRIFLETIYKPNNPFKGRKHTEENKKKIAALVSERNKRLGISVPKWGAEKGRLACIKPVIAYDSNTGNFMSEHESLTAAANFYGIKISAVKDSLIKNRVSYKKYYFRYKTSEDYPKNIEPIQYGEKDEAKEVVGIYNGEIKFFDKAKTASEYYNLPIGTIRRAARYNNLRPIRKGHIFVYRDDYENSLKTNL